MHEAKFDEIKLNEARDHYCPAAASASKNYFIMNDLNMINPMYRFSPKVNVNFCTLFILNSCNKQLTFYLPFRHLLLCFTKLYNRLKSLDVHVKVTNLIDAITYSIFNYVSRGLFEKDKLTFTAQNIFQACI